jgi:hypothetical protein
VIVATMVLMIQGLNNCTPTSKNMLITVNASGPT